MRRVVITGMGVISSLGQDLDTFWNNLKNGKSGVSLIERFDTTDFGTKIAGEIKSFNAEDYMDKKLSTRMDRYAQFGVAAAKLAMNDAGLAGEHGIDPYRMGVTVGSGIGGLQVLQDNAKAIIEKGPRRVSPMFVPSSILDIAAGYIAMLHNLRGPNYAVTSACATGPHGMVSAFNHIKNNDADIMVAGGAEAAMTELGIAGFIQARALSSRNDDPQTASRPFDIGRDGFVMAEGAGVLILEEYEHAKKRGAKIYGELLSYGVTADAYHITAPHPDGEGAGTAMKIAMKNGNITPDQVDLINMHGTSTPLGDIAETKAIKFAMGEDAYKTHCNSTKSMLGHALGAAGAIEAIAIMKMMEHNTIHPTINIFNQDPECDLNYTANVAVEKELNIVLSNSFGFGGHNVSLAFKKI